MIDVTRELSQRFKNMALVCAFIVVMIHCVSGFNVFGPLVFYVMDDSCFRIAVPFFFFASGFFLYGHVDENNWWGREILKRVHSLLVPYIVLSVLFAIPSLMIGVASNDEQLSAGVLLSTFGLNPFVHPRLVPLWHIRALFIIVLISPVLVFMVRRFGRWSLLITFALYGLLGPYEGMPGLVHYVFRKTIAVQGIFYVSMGMVFRSGRVNVIVCRPHALGVLSLGTLLMAVKVYLQYHSNHLYLYFGWLAIPFLMLGVFSLITTRRWPDWCTSCAFPIYLVHFFVIRLAALTCSWLKVADVVRTDRLIWVGVSVIVGVVTWGACALQRRLFPGMNTILYGGR